jgi:hypothetical protein
MSGSSRTVMRRNSGSERIQPSKSLEDLGLCRSQPSLAYDRAVSNTQARSPWYVRVWGWILLLLGLLDLLSYGYSLTTDDMVLRPVDFIPTIVFAAGAIGLLSESRWGWTFGLLTGLLGFSVGVYILLDLSIYGGDITVLGLEFVAMFLIVAGLLLVFSLLTPRTRKWVAQLPGRRNHSTTSNQ